MRIVHGGLVCLGLNRHIDIQLDAMRGTGGEPGSKPFQRIGAHPPPRRR
jgi:hypothetical protein